MKNLYFLTIILMIVASSNVLNGQKRMAVYATQSTGGEASIKVVPEKIISFFSNDEDFVIIDRKNKQLIKAEMRLQKSESFIDGYIVEQGKAEGADIICQSTYDHKSKQLIIQMMDVATGETFCSQEKQLKSSWIKGLKALDQELTIMLHDISVKCFDKSFPVVRMTKSSKGKAKELLVLAGYAQKMKLKYSMEIVSTVEEKIGDITKMRKTAIGYGYVTQIEDENFSILKIQKGHKEIFKALEKGATLQCRLIKR